MRGFSDGNTAMHEFLTRLPHFIGNHVLLVAALVVIILALIALEISRKFTGYRELTPGALAAMEAYVAHAAARHGYSRHRYQLEQFGLSAGQVREQLKAFEHERIAQAA